MELRDTKTVKRLNSSGNVTYHPKSLEYHFTDFFDYFEYEYDYQYDNAHIKPVT